MLRRATVVVDSRDVALAESGAVAMAIEENAITAADVRAELGQVLLEGSFQRSPLEITLFNSVGLPIQDLAAVTALLSATRGALA